MLFKFIKEHKNIYWFLGFVGALTVYFGSKFLPLSYRVIHVPFDDKIPFLPVFIIPYVLWYAFVPFNMLLVYFKDNENFGKQAMALFTGVYICSALFIIYPTCIDFRPSAEGRGVLLFICRIVYANDTPSANVFPSLHCFEALSVYLSAFWGSKVLRKNIPLNIGAFVLTVLICASTVFVKQHSIVDVVSGCLLAVVLFLLTEICFKFKGNKNGNKRETDNISV